jgi:hypothetical protein
MQQQDEGAVHIQGPRFQGLSEPTHQFVHDGAAIDADLEVAELPAPGLARARALGEVLDDLGQVAPKGLRTAQGIHRFVAVRDAHE